MSLNRVMGLAAIGLLSATLPTAAVHAQSYAVVHSFLGGFGSGADGCFPTGGPLLNVAGTLYGETGGNCYTSGSVYSVSPTGTETVLTMFPGSNTPTSPEGGVILVSGDFYGVSYSDADFTGPGTVFRMTPAGKVKVLTYFDTPGYPAPGGYFPSGGLIRFDNRFYGTTTGGGTSSSGVVFKVTGSGEETPVYQFGGSPDACGGGSLTKLSGTLYGVSYLCGAYGNPNSGQPGYGGYGAVYAVTAAGVENVLYSFKGGADGGGPNDNLIVVDGRLYGTTRYGGATNNGTVFSLSRAGVKRTLYSFAGGTDGQSPTAGLTYVNGLFYGTTQDGGAASPYAYGTLFSLTPRGVKTVLYSFGNGINDAASPNSPLTYVNGTLYGTTFQGGTAFKGTVYSYTP